MQQFNLRIDCEEPVMEISTIGAIPIGGSTLKTKIQGIIDTVKGDPIKADYVILLTHLGFGGDATFGYTSEGLLRELKNVNAVIDGHTHLVYSGKFKDAEKKEVIIAQAGSKLGSIGVLTISSKDGTFSHEIIKEIPKISTIIHILAITLVKK